MYWCLCLFTMGKIHPNLGRLFSSCWGGREGPWTPSLKQDGSCSSTVFSLSHRDSSRNPQKQYCFNPCHRSELSPNHSGAMVSPHLPTAQRHCTKSIPNSSPVFAPRLNFPPRAHTETSAPSQCCTSAAKAESERTACECWGRTITLWSISPSHSRNTNISPFSLLGQRVWWQEEHGVAAGYISTCGNHHSCTATTMWDQI